jgi:hypothetical protein
LRDDQADWNDVDVISTNLTGEPAVRVGIRIAVNSRVRFDVPNDAGHAACQDWRCVDDMVFVGVGETLFVLRPLEGTWDRIRLEDYFGALYTPEDFGLSASSFGLLVASGTALFNLTRTGGLLWCARGLAVDGVLVSDAHDGLIFGSAELDPLGGWQPFVLGLSTGERQG